MWVNFRGKNTMNALKTDKKDEIRNLYLKTGNIRGVATALGISRNTVRKLLREDGLSSRKVKFDLGRLQVDEPSIPPTNEVASTALQGLDFVMLEKMFSRTHEPNSANDFKRHIMSMALDIGKEIGVTGRLDTVRLETAICSYISFRRFYFRSLKTPNPKLKIKSTRAI